MLKPRHWLCVIDVTNTSISITCTSNNITLFGGNSFTISSYHSFYDSLAISLYDSRDKLSTDFFHKILHPSSCIHYLFPNKRHNNQIHKLRNHSLYPPPFARTQKFNEKLIRLWDSERQLFLRRHRAHTTKYNRLVHKFRHRSTRLCVGMHVFTKFTEITQYNGHYVVQGHSRSPILVPIESSHTTSY